MSRAECESCTRQKTVEWGELGLLTSNAGSFHRHAVPSLVIAGERGGGGGERRTRDWLLRKRSAPFLNNQ